MRSEKNDDEVHREEIFSEHQVVESIDTSEDFKLKSLDSNPNSSNISMPSSVQAKIDEEDQYDHMRSENSNPLLFMSDKPENKVSLADIFMRKDENDIEEGNEFREEVKLKQDDSESSIVSSCDMHSRDEDDKMKEEQKKEEEKIEKHKNEKSLYTKIEQWSSTAKNYVEHNKKAAFTGLAITGILFAAMLKLKKRKS